MKTILFFPILSVTLSRAITPIKPRNSSLKCLYMTPFILNGETNLYLDVNASSSKPLRVKLTQFNEIFTEGDVILDATYTSSGVYTYTYDNESTHKNNTVQIAVYDSTARISSLMSYEIPLLKSQYKQINSNNEIIDDIPSYIFTPKNGWDEIYPTYQFDGFDELYIPTFYHKIDFSDFKIMFDDYNYSTFNPKATFGIQNYTAKYFKTDSDSFSYVDLNVVKEGNNTVHFEPVTPFYVNMETLEMSLNKHLNYVKTKHFYLPRNEYKDQNIYTFYLIFENFGSSKNKVIHTFKFNALINTIGDCVNSEYCIVRS